MRFARCVIPAVAALLFASPAAFGWGSKEHIQFARLAAERLIDRPDTPPAMKEWLKRNLGGPPLTMEQERDYFLYRRIGAVPHGADGLPFWATMPDMRALMDSPGKKAPDFDVPERLLHFVDVEYFNAAEANRTYAHDLSHKPRPEDFPDDDMKDWRWARAGVLPFSVRHSYKMLVESVRAGRLEDKPGQYPRDEHAVKWAGALAHYAADNTQPQHATIDYKSETYFAEKRKAPNVHSQVEYEMADGEDEDYMELRKEFWPLFADALDKQKDPVQTADPWRATVEVSLASYDALPLIGLAAMAAAKQGGTPQKPEGATQQPFDTVVFFHFKGQFKGREMTVMEMKALQTAWAVHRIERLWRQAWDEAQAPAPAAGAAQPPAANPAGGSPR